MCAPSITTSSCPIQRSAGIQIGPTVNCRQQITADQTRAYPRVPARKTRPLVQSPLLQAYTVATWLILAPAKALAAHSRCVHVTLWVVKGGRGGIREDGFGPDPSSVSGGARSAICRSTPIVTRCGPRTAGEHAERPEGHVNTQAAQLWAFGHRMQIGDPVVVPFLGQPEIAIGEITGPYRWVPDGDPDMPHVREVTWHVTDLPRVAFDPDLRYSFGGSVTVTAFRHSQPRRAKGPRDDRRPLGPRLQLACLHHPGKVRDVLLHHAFEYPIQQRRDQTGGAARLPPPSRFDLRSTFDRHEVNGHLKWKRRRGGLPGDPAVRFKRGAHRVILCGAATECLDHGSSRGADPYWRR